MTNPAMPGLPGFGAITETMELVRNMWGGMSAPGVGIPGMVMPTLSVEEINKQISDLKAVESWLTLNMNMLRGTIQALEVQSATISTLRSMGETLSAAVKPAAPAPAPSPAFSFPFGSAAPTEAKPAPAAAPAAVAPAPAPTPTAAPEPTPAATDGTAPLANPAAWWNMLQDQFKQAVSTALTPEAGSGAAKAGGKPGRTSASVKAAGTSGGLAAQSQADAAPKKPARSPARPATKSAAKATIKTAVKPPARPR